MSAFVGHLLGHFPPTYHIPQEVEEALISAASNGASRRLLASMVGVKEKEFSDWLDRIALADDFIVDNAHEVCRKIRSAEIAYEIDLLGTAIQKATGPQWLLERRNPVYRLDNKTARLLTEAEVVKQTKQDLAQVLSHVSEEGKKAILKALNEDS